MISGLYQGQDGDSRLALRIDVDGARPMHRVSGDLFTVAGATTSYVGSFVVHAPTVQAGLIQGAGDFTFAPPVRDVSITITGESGTAAVAGRTYQVTFVSPHFRSVLLEQDSVVGTLPFVAYRTGTLPGPAGSPARELTLVSAYAEAGIELTVAEPGVIPVEGSGLDLAWDDAELHHAMSRHFSAFGDAVAWRLWLLVAGKHTGGYRGIMFDYNDAHQRQGAAVFYDAIKGDTPQAQRAQLRTYVHELGHAFNLLHSWQKNLATPPQPLGPNGGFGDLSWMNYVQNYRPGGEQGYWAAFPFQFTDAELIHLRHGFYRDVAMGANAFGTGAAEIDPFEQPVEDRSGLRLELRAKESYELGEPVVLELKLAYVAEPRTTHGHLHPDTEFTQVSITQPGGRTVLYRPMMRHCVDTSPEIRLDPGNPAIYRSAYIGHGRDGHYFQLPGEYQIRAQYIAADGSRIVSPACPIRVRLPVSREDHLVAELMLGEDQGKLFSLMGSDSPALRAGNQALDEVIERYGDHPLAVYARLVKGLNAEREFKELTPGNRLRVRPPDPKQGIEHLTAVARDASIDNITLNLAMRRLARAEARQGDMVRANAVMDEMVATFEAKGVNAIVLGQIRRQAELTKAALGAELS
ncbi:zinc metalloprotease [Nonomuraea gerenzanensis]|uniref:Uncharacterized protein n=1 Tax=Nonomuraea gerenzanensis TaxID=93944 RepID=A0A1M4E3S3_9ACTN|nr:hypothetical protein [Nonomuraea gerenzanensis]UBU15684.1 hypothetical protein LCN96_11890 [Nonomuraea gerenzanensis]SBO93458.1 hypothetical protein BN4615_P2972 [Nonomuraea gerenzanensis]